MKLDYFESQEGLTKLLTDYKDIINMIEDYGQQFIAGVLSTQNEYKEALTKLTGAYITLEPLYSVAVAYKLNGELKFYVEKKREMEANGEKVTAAHLDKEASHSVEELRRVRNILEGYVSACEKGIITCQTQIKRIDRDEKYKPVEG